MVKKIYISFLFLLAAIIQIKAQDIIHRTDTSTIRAKILEVGIYEIKFKKYDNPDGPTYTLKKSDVALIVYENGIVDIITQPKAGKGGEGNVTSFKKNIISVYMLDFLIDRLTVSYEHIFYDGYLGVNVPLSFGIFSQTKGTFVTGADLNYYPSGQKKFGYFLGPKLRFGNYGNIAGTAPLNYGTNDSFVSFFLNNGVAFTPKSGFRFLLSGGIGVLSKTTESSSHFHNYGSKLHRTGNSVYPWGSINLNIGFSF